MVECLTWDIGCWFESLWRHHIVSLCKTRYTLFSTGSTKETSGPDWKFLDWHGRIQRGRGAGRGSGPTLKDHNLFLAILVQIRWKIAKLLGQNSMLGLHRDASWRPDDGPLLVVFWSSLLSSTKKKKKKKRCQSWTPSDKSFWIRAWLGCKESTQIIEVHSCSVLVC